MSATTLDFTNPVQVLAATLAGEIREGNRQQRENVACCILKRQELGYAPTLIRVCLQPAQFSCWNPRTIHSAVNENYLEMINMASREPSVWAQLLDVAQDAVAGKLVSHIGEADSYYNPRRVNGGKPYWAKAPAFETANDGLHIFWRVRYLNKVPNRLPTLS